MAKMKHDDTAADKKLIKKAVGMHDKQLHGGKKTDLASLKKGGKAKGADVKIAMMKKEPAAKPDMGAMMPQRPQAMPPMAQRQMAAPAGMPPMMCGGGKVKKMASGGLAAGHKSADGVAVKGKTKGKTVTMSQGGKAKRYC